MCGIFGIFARNGLRDRPEQVLAGSAVASHRGPDGSGAMWFDTRAQSNGSVLGEAERWTADTTPTVLLCHRRLSIIDLSDQGRQPMSNGDGSIWLTYNGELYNYLELRDELSALGVAFRTHSDAEVLLKAYEHWGLSAYSRFRGMWAFAILDLRSRQLILSRDRFGIKPLYYFTQHNLVGFGSEIKQLLEIPECPRRVNGRAVFDYLQYETTDLGTETFFSGISRVRPGCSIVIPLDSDETQEERYYSLPISHDSIDLTPSQAADRFLGLFRDSVQIHLRSDVPVGTCLSGGLDSSSIAMLMRQISLDQDATIERHAFNCHFDVPEANELEYTQLSMEAAHVIPHFVEPTDNDIQNDLRKLVWHQDEPFGSTSIYAQWSVFRLVREQGIKVVLDGQGADEILGGYSSFVPYIFLDMVAKGHWLAALRESWQWAKHQEVSWISQIPSPVLLRIIDAMRLKPRSASAEASWIGPDLASAHARDLLYIKGRSERPFSDNEPFSNLLYQFCFNINLPMLLRYEDRNSMAFSVEARVPFLDHRLVEFIFSLPTNLKFRGGFTKRVLRDAMSGILPERVRMRARKMGFATPERRWQTGVLNGLVNDAIGSNRLRPYLRASEARQHFARVVNDNVLSFAPWRWVNLMMWMEEFKLS